MLSIGTQLFVILIVLGGQVYQHCIEAISITYPYAHFKHLKSKVHPSQIALQVSFSEPGNACPFEGLQTLQLFKQGAQMFGKGDVWLNL